VTIKHAGCSEGIPDLLLVMPTLGELSRDIKPYGCGLRAYPTHRSAECVQVERAKVFQRPFTRDAQEVTQYLRTQSPRGHNPELVQAIDKFDNALVSCLLH
jgi:hypothetical protein